MKTVLFCALFLVSLFSSPLYSTTFTADNSSGTTDWNEGLTWGPTHNSPGVMGIDYPGPGDAVSIPGGAIVDIPAGYAASCAKLNLNNNQIDYGAQLTLMSSTSSLTLTGSMQMLPWTGGASAFSGFQGNTITMNGGTITIGGNLTATCYDDGDLFFQQTIVTGAGTLTVNGNCSFTNNGIALATINMNTANSVLNLGAGFTLGTLNNGAGTNGTINYFGTGAQTILSAITYYRLGISGGSLKTLNGNTSVNNTLTLTSGNINMATFTLTLGMDNGVNTTAGTLSYTSGWAYNGSFRRHFDFSLIGLALGNTAGLIPVGSSLHYRPLWVAIPSTLGLIKNTLTVTHNADYSWPAHNNASHVDGSWGGGTTLKGTSKSSWTIATVGFDTDGNNEAQLRFGGFGFATNTLTDLNATLAASVEGTFSAATGTSTEPYVNRTNITDGALTNTWRIGTKNLIQSPLPIELISFNAFENMSVVDLEWTTASETNNDYFTIERSKDALNWEELKHVDGAGNSLVVINYHDNDPTPYSGTSFYRLKQTDFNGSVSYSNIESVNFEGIKIIHAYPIPANDNLNISINSSFDSMVKIELYNSIGQTVYQQDVHCGKGINSINIDVNKYNAGNYIIRILSDELSLSDKMLFNINK